MKNLQALLFDVDGTLADTERDGHLVAYNQAFVNAALDWHWDEQRYGELLAIAGGRERLRHYIDEYLDNVPAGQRSDDFIARLHQDKTACFQRILARGQLGLRPGIKRLIADARERKVRLAISTTTTESNVELLLSNTLGPESPGWFEVIAAGGMVQHKKPAPDIYQLALEKLQLDPAVCIAIEDSRNGYVAASRAGLTTVVTVCDYTVGDDFSGHGEFPDAALVLSSAGDPGAAADIIHGRLEHDYLTLADLDSLLED